MTHYGPTQPFSEELHAAKYRGERETFKESQTRIAGALADNREHFQVFRDICLDMRFMAAGRVQTAMGSTKNVTPYNCYVSGTIEDSFVDGPGNIMMRATEAAATMRMGGGIGYDFSSLRPRGATIKKLQSQSSGPISFMEIFDAICRCVASSGHRRGAQMGVLRVDHPDIEEFIHAKQNDTRFQGFNISIGVTDEFMNAVQMGIPFDLKFEGEVYKTIDARALWDNIMHSTWDWAEPGVLFVDRINKMNNLHYCETIAATNPCGEQPLPPYGACLLGSFNLVKYVKEQNGKRYFDFNQFRADIPPVVRAMDNIIDRAIYPLPAQEKEATDKRRMGLGYTGLANAIEACGHAYGSPAFIEMQEVIACTLRDTAYEASALLAYEKGAFPLFDAEKYLSSGNMMQMDDDVREAIRTHGIRNALLTSVAPTGTISLYAGNVSSGIEPVFAYAYTRKVLQKDGTRTEEEVVDYAVKMWRDLHGDAELPDYFVNAQTLPAMDHVRMQAAAQKWVDSSISKTINVPEDIDFQSFKDVYMEAWDSGCKGCTTYRPNDVTGSVLSVSQESKPELIADENAGDVIYMTEPLDRPGELTGQTYKLKWPDSEHAIYITVNDILHQGQHRPFEVFINSKNMEHFAWTVALTRMISAVFRRGGDVSFVVEELKAVFDPRGGAWMQGKYVPSILAAIGGVIEKHMVSTGFLAGEGMGLKSDPQADVVNIKPKGKACPNCGQYSLRMVEGCMTCADCGNSKCG